MDKEYIEKDAAIALAKDIVVGTYHHRCIDPQDIQELPSADVKPVVYGYWIERYRNGFGNMICECSNCHSNSKRRNFCFNCGADMRGNVKCPKGE